MRSRTRDNSANLHQWPYQGNACVFNMISNSKDDDKVLIRVTSFHALPSGIRAPVLSDTDTYATKQSTTPTQWNALNTLALSTSLQPDLNTTSVNKCRRNTCGQTRAAVSVPAQCKSTFNQDLVQHSYVGHLA